MPEKLSSKWFLIIISLLVGIPAIWVCVTFLLLPVLPEVGATGGVKGDSFGAVNALFSGFALAGVVVAIMLQSEELKLQRQELAETRDELRGQKEQLEAQVNRGLQEEFDARFFEVIRFWRSSVESLATPIGGTMGTWTGSRALSIMVQMINPRGFIATNGSFQDQLTVPMQWLIAAFTLLSDARSTSFHRQLLQASCGTAERETFFRFLLDFPSTAMLISTQLDETEFFKHMAYPGGNIAEKGMSKRAFGVQET